MRDMTNPLGVFLVDDHATVRQALKLLIDAQPDMTVVGEASDGRTVLEQVETLVPDVVVMDISMPGMNGLLTTKKLKRTQPNVSIVVLTRHADDVYMQELLGAGVSGYVLKQSPSEEFLRALRVAAAGGQYLDSTMTKRVTGELVSSHGRRSDRPSARLTGRESDVLRLIASGYSNKEIAAQLEISVKTVEVHKANAMRKLDLKGRVHIIRYATLQGWLHDV
jgi:DNA-binding NarL/FixJ family response regulator